jgi:hypothetical protein
MHMAPRSWEVALSLLAGLGFGLALGRGDLIFVAVLALLVQWRLSEGCNVSRKSIGSAIAIRALPDLCFGSPTTWLCQTRRVVAGVRTPMA